jgi:hypothetical protein
MPPRDEQQSQPTGLPQGVSPLVMEQFAGINTLAARVSVPDQQMYWCDGFMPLAPGRLRTMADIGAPLFSIGVQITKLFCTLGQIFTWTADGSLFRYDGSANNQIAGPGTFPPNAPSTSLGACTIPGLVAGTPSVIFVSDQVNGYFIFQNGLGLALPGGTTFYGVVPTGISGHSVELYSGHVWVATPGGGIVASAPGSYVDFATSSGGVAFNSPDSFQQFQYTCLKSAGGFLYCVADNSTSYISGVSTSGTPPSTGFTYQNADSTMGAFIWNDAVISVGRDLLIANPNGVFRLRGGAMTKISYELDGFYLNAGTDPALCFGETEVFGRRIWCLLMAVEDLVTGATSNKLLIYDGERWFTSPQGVNLTFITTFEQSSNLALVGTDGTNVYELFTTPTTAFTKTVQSRLWTTPDGYHSGKAASRFWALTNYSSVNSPNLTVKIDNEANSQPYTIVGPAGTGYFVTPPQAIGQQGVLTGMTISTNCDDMEINSAMIGAEVVQYRG